MGARADVYRTSVRLQLRRENAWRGNDGKRCSGHSVERTENNVLAQSREGSLPAVREKESEMLLWT